MTSTEIVHQDASQQLDRVPDSALDRAARLGMWLAAAESKSTDPKAKGMAAALRIAYAESLGLPAHMASEVHIINGGLSTSAQIQRAQAYCCGFHVVPIEETDDSCTAKVVERSTGKQVGRNVTFTLADAKRMGLLEKHNWKTNPGAMLFARASTKAIGVYIPHVKTFRFSSEQLYRNSMEAVYSEGAEVEVLDPEDEVPFGDAPE